MNKLQYLTLELNNEIAKYKREQYALKLYERRRELYRKRKRI